jgi:regulator of Ty1 transposition protein 103
LKATVSSADQEYEKQTDTSTPVPSAPVYAARLNGLLKTLATAESAVADCMKARAGLVSGLEKLLESNRAALEFDRQTLSKISTRKSEIEEKKQQVEMGIMQALGSSENQASPVEGGSVSPPAEPDRPEMEALTPPAVEAFTPPPVEALTPPGEKPSAETHEAPSDEKAGATGIEMLSNVASSYQSLPVTSNGSNKRRRVDDSGDFPDLGGDDGIDADVAAMLNEGST